MRISRLTVFFVCFACAIGAARADVKSYCTAYARDAADTALGFTGVGTLAGTNNAQWSAENSRALEQCLTLYGQPQEQTAAQKPAATEQAGKAAKDAPKPAQAGAAPKPAKPPAAAPKPAKPQPMKLISSAHASPLPSVSPSQQGGSAGKSGLQPGSAAWNAYCAKKYTSFNPATGTYKSYKGNYRRCVVTK